MDLIDQIKVNIPNIENIIIEFVKDNWNRNIISSTDILSKIILDTYGYTSPKEFSDLINKKNVCRDSRALINILRGVFKINSFDIIYAGRGKTYTINYPPIYNVIDDVEKIVIVNDIETNHYILLSGATLPE